MENFVVIQYADPELFELNLSKWKEELKYDIFLWNLNPNVDKLTIHELIAKFPMNTKIVRHCEVDRYHSRVFAQIGHETTYASIGNCRAATAHKGLKLPKRFTNLHLGSMSSILN